MRTAAARDRKRSPNGPVIPSHLPRDSITGRSSLMFQCHLVSLFTRGDYQEEHESQTVMQFSCNVEAQVYNSHQITISESSKRTMVEQSSSDAGTLHNLQAFMAETSWTARAPGPTHADLFDRFWQLRCVVNIGQ